MSKDEYADEKSSYVNLAESESAHAAASGFLEAISDFYVSGYYLDLKSETFQTFCQKQAYKDRYGAAKSWSTMDDYIRECVHPDDQALITEASRIPYIRERLSREQYYSIEVRDLATGSERWYRYTTMRGHDVDHAAIVFVDATDVVHARHERETLNCRLQETLEDRDAQIEEIVALNAELEDRQSQLEEVTAEQEAQIEEISALNAELESARDTVSEAYGMIEGLSQDYHTIWVVDKETSKMRLIRSSGKSTIQGAVQMGLDMPEFDTGFNDYIETYVEPEDRERMHRQIAFAEVLRQLEANPDKLYAVNYLRRTDDGKVGYHQIAFANADTKDGHRRFVYGFRDVDAIVKEERDKQEALRKARDEAEAHSDALDALNKELSEQSDIVANAGLGMWHIILKDGCAPRMQANWKMLEILGIPGRTDLSEEEVYSWWWDRITPDAIPSVNASVAEMLGGKFSENTYLWEHPEKGLIYTRCGGTCVTLEDGTHVISGYHGDVTDLVREDQEQKKALAQARDAADVANAAKTSFLFNMSHDIRTPMNAIIGFTDLLKKHQDDPDRRADYLEKIQDSSDILLSIINNVLEMARIEKGIVEVDETAWSAEQFNDTLYSVFREMMKEKRIEFTRQVVVTNNYVFCDPIKLREVFINILSNAWKYTNPGGKVNMHLEEIPSNRPGYALYQTTITDTGIGMSEDFLPHIFEEFTREQSTTEAKVEGTGLGMPIVKRLVEVMEGTIEVQSQKGVGTTFIVTIPHRIAERSDLTGHKEADVDPQLFEGKHILLAEDNDLNAEIAMEILSEAGFVVDRAEDGVVCVDMLKSSSEDCYDAILMDIQMPRMNGYEATRAIRAMENSTKAHIPILAMTANAFEEDRREAMRSGMDGHIAKPINVSQLFRMLAGALGGGSQR